MLRENSRLVQKLDEIQFEKANNHSAPVIKMNAHLNIAR